MTKFFRASNNTVFKTELSWLPEILLEEFATLSTCSSRPQWTVTRDAKPMNGCWTYSAKADAGAAGMCIGLPVHGHAGLPKAKEVAYILRGAPFGQSAGLLDWVDITPKAAGKTYTWAFDILTPEDIRRQALLALDKAGYRFTPEQLRAAFSPRPAGTFKGRPCEVCEVRVSNTGPLRDFVRNGERILICDPMNVELVSIFMTCDPSPKVKTLVVHSGDRLIRYLDGAKELEVCPKATWEAAKLGALKPDDSVFRTIPDGIKSCAQRVSEWFAENTTGGKWALGGVCSRKWESEWETAHKANEELQKRVAELQADIQGRETERQELLRIAKEDRITVARLRDELAAASLKVIGFEVGLKNLGFTPPKGWKPDVCAREVAEREHRIQELEAQLAALTEISKGWKAQYSEFLADIAGKLECDPDPKACRGALDIQKQLISDLELAAGCKTGVNIRADILRLIDLAVKAQTAKLEAKLKEARDRVNALMAQRDPVKLGGDACVIEGLRRRLKEAEGDVRSWRRKAEAAWLDTQRLDYAEANPVKVLGKWNEHVGRVGHGPATCGLRGVIDGCREPAKQAL